MWKSCNSNIDLFETDPTITTTHTILLSLSEKIHKQKYFSFFPLRKLREYMKNSKQKLKKWRVGNVLMVNLNQILLNFFLPPPNLFTAAERITDSCLPFKKQLCQWRKITTFGNIYLLVIFLDRQIVSSEHSSNMRTETPSWLDGILQRLVPESCYEKPTGTHRAWKEL